jgi:hypothetical protein
MAFLNPINNGKSIESAIMSTTTYCSMIFKFIFLAVCHTPTRQIFYTLQERITKEVNPDLPQLHID